MSEHGVIEGYEAMYGLQREYADPATFVDAILDMTAADCGWKPSWVQDMRHIETIKPCWLAYRLSGGYPEELTHGWWDYPLTGPKPRGGVLGWRTP